MDFNFFFRRFFSDNVSSIPESFFEAGDFEGNNKTDDMIFGDSFERFNSGHIFQEMEDIFNKMFMPFSTIDIPGFGENMLPSFEERVPPNEQNPRSLMLKQPEEKASSCKKQHEGSSISPYSDSRKELHKPQLFSYSKFSSVKTVRLPDGTVEEHRTFVDSDGKKTTKVRRSIGDTTHEIITKSDKEGFKEKEENFLNMDENEIAEFEKKWNKLRNGTNPQPEQPKPSSLGIPESSPMYLYLFNKFFGSSQKEELKSC